MKLFQFITIALSLVTLSCNDKIDYYDVGTYSKDQVLRAVIEIPAGTNKKLEYSKETNTFEIDKENGKDRVIEYLPYLGNYGFIPSTYSSPEKGGDGDALDIIVLSESLPTGTVVEVVPLGVLKLIDDGELDYKIVANIHDSKKRVINASNFEELTTKYPSIKKIIELWFLNYNPEDPSLIEGWGNNKQAEITIQDNLR